MKDLIIFAAGCAIAFGGFAAPEKPVVELIAAERVKVAEIAAVRPSARQLAWQKHELTAFFHFGVNTFTGREWGTGNENPSVFNPSDLDCRQWVKAAKAAGVKLAILTAKHHDGFCLWPTKMTAHSVKSAAWRGGKGDVCMEFVKACRAEGVKVGMYLSPWDRHEKSYGTAAYNDFYVAQLEELFDAYGPIDEIWLDGACGEGPNGKKQVYDFPRYFAAIRERNPNCVIAISGPDVRWIGNENGVAGESEWSVVKVDGKWVWYPAECDVSIRPGWFYHKKEDAQVKSLEELMRIYDCSVGRNAVLLLNIPPMPGGRLHENDVTRLKEFGEKIKRDFSENLLGEVKSGELEVMLKNRVTFDTLMLQEDIAQGQLVERFHIDAFDEKSKTWEVVTNATTIGYKRIIRLARPVTANGVRVVVDESRAEPHILHWGAYCAVPNTAMGEVTKLDGDAYDWFARHEHIVGKVKDGYKPDVLLVGDSITHHWGPETDCKINRGTASREKLFGDLKVLNIGFGWDRIQNVRWRLKNGEIDGISPKLVVLHIGTNNYSDTKYARQNTPVETAEGIRDIALMLARRFPDAKILVFDVFPRGPANSDVRKWGAAVNRELSAYGSWPENVKRLSLAKELTDNAGNLLKGAFVDGVHPSDKGYEIWAEKLRPELTAAGLKPNSLPQHSVK